MEQLQEYGPVGIGAAIIVVLVVLALVRKLMTMIFLAGALGFGGWAGARQLGWDIPFTLPGEVTDADRSAMETAASIASQVASAGGVVRPQALDTRTAAPPASEPLAQPEAVTAQAAADEVRQSDIAYNAPTTMQLNMPVDIRLAIGAAGTDPDSELEGLPGDVREGQAELTEQVTASLSGTGFEIRPLRPLRQVLGDARTTTWQWEVTPRTAGAQTLNLEVFAHPGGSDAADAVASYSDQIDVQVTFVSQALAFAQTTQPVIGFAAGGVSLLLAAMSFVRRRRK